MEKSYILYPFYLITVMIPTGRSSELVTDTSNCCTAS